MLPANQIVGFLNFNISKTSRASKLIFCMGTYLLKLQVYDVILREWGLACPGIPKEAIETLRSQKLEKV